MIITEKPGKDGKDPVISLHLKNRRRNSTSTTELAGVPSAGSYRGRQPSPMRASPSLGRTEYSNAFRDASISSPGGPRAFQKGLSDRVRKSEETGRSPGAKAPEVNGSGLGSAPPQSPKSPVPAPRTSGVLGLSRQGSDKIKSRSLLASGDFPSSFRQAGRVGSYNARGVSTPLSHTMPSMMGRPGRAPGISSEQEMQLGEAVIVYGSSTFQGLRDYQEDTIAFLPGVNSMAGAVYDGHGGDQVSRELERVLLQNMVRNVADQDSIPAIQAAISQTYVATNREISLRMAAAAEAGSCAVTFLITRAAGALHLFCANAGDCRAVLFTGPQGGKRPVRLSEDHKPHPQVCPQEIRRVTGAGGCVLWGRVQGCLAVSRAFGDKTLHPYVIADPYISTRQLNLDQDSFLYLASDGVTDMVDDLTGCQVVADQLARGSSTSQAAQALVSTAYQKGSSDNISVVVVKLRRR